MGYAISVDEHDAIAKICLTGEIPHGEHLKARDELLALCRSRDIHKILVDARELIAATGTMALFDFSASWAQLAQRTPVILAGVLPRDPATKESLRFGDTVAANRGLVTHAFEDPDQARRWLRDAR